MPTRRPRLSQMIRQLLSSIIAHNLLGEWKFAIEMILIRILRRLPRRRPRPRKHFLSRPTEPGPRRRHISGSGPILSPFLIIPTRLIRIRRHILPRNRRPANTTIKTNRLGIIKLGEPLKRGLSLSRRHTPHTTPRHPRITLSPTQIHAQHFPSHIRQRPTQTIRALGDRRQFTPRTPILATHSVPQIIQLRHNMKGAPPTLSAGRPITSYPTRPHSA